MRTFRSARTSFEVLRSSLRSRSLRQNRSKSPCSERKAGITARWTREMILSRAHADSPSLCGCSGATSPCSQRG